MGAVRKSYEKKYTSDLMDDVSKKCGKAGPLISQIVVKGGGGGGKGGAGKGGARKHSPEPGKGGGKKQEKKPANKKGDAGGKKGTGKDGGKKVRLQNALTSSFVIKLWLLRLHWMIYCINIVYYGIWHSVMSLRVSLILSH